MKYRSANSYFREKFGKKMYKASISLDVTCPNRDGTKGVGGCIFCSCGGSGEFPSSSKKSITDQIDDAVLLLSKKIKTDAGYIAYFQSFTSTYCSADYLRSALAEATDHPLIEAVSIGTRPDCLGNDILQVLDECNRKIPLFVELGLQTSNDATGELINRCYKTSDFVCGVEELKRRNINVIAHVIFGLPGETKEDMMNTVRFVNYCGVDGVKFTCLYVLRGTKLLEMYNNKGFEVLGMEEYFDIVGDAIGLLDPDVVVHRLTGDGPKSLLVAPLWTSNKREVVNYINRRFSDG